MGVLADNAKLTAIAASPFPLLKLAWCLALLLLLFLPVIKDMVLEWARLEEMSHGFFVPVVAGWVAWNQRENWLRPGSVPSFAGLILVLWGFLQMLIAQLGAEFFLARSALLISLVGVIWTLGGWATVRGLALPLFLLAFMIRIPTLLYNQVTFPLQLFASTVAEHGLDFIGIPVLRDGNVLELPSQRLSVVEACSGIRSLLSLSFLSLVYAYLFDRKVWMRIALLIATVPIAIVANAGRVMLTGAVGEYNKEWSQGFFHTLEGWIVFMVALAALVITHNVINRVYGLWRKKEQAA